MVTPGTPPVPHVGGPILPPGCPTVLIGGQPAARMGDLATCVGPPDSIVMGSPTVLIGGQPAARLGDPAAHGGAITLGMPAVLIGEAAAGAPAGPAVARLPNGDLRVGQNTVLTGTEEFKAKALADLRVIDATPTGHSIFAALDAGAHTVTIQELDMATAQRNGALARREDPAGAKDPKKGSATTISYQPDLKDQYTDQHGNKVDVPVEATLGHEMIHAVHNSGGTNLRDLPDPKERGSNQEESRTIGINDHAGEPMSENNLLKDLGAGYQRTDHDMSVTTG
jgi:uncharacterized Zn-binding protein involved in type VI secretion